jgi:AcrR family transcriptional regulator
MRGRDSRENIYRAAMRLANREGLLTLTLDNVAVEAGLSKGGVLHHFANKEALLAGVIGYFTEQVEALLMEMVAAEPKSSFRWARAMLQLESAATPAADSAHRTVPADRPAVDHRSGSPDHGLRQDSQPGQRSGASGRTKRPASLSAGLSPDVPHPEALDRFMLGVLAAVVHQPELIKPVQAVGQRLRGRLTAVPEEGLEQILTWLVIDGLFLWRFVGMIAQDDPMIGQVLQALQQRLDAAEVGLMRSAGTAAPGENVSTETVAPLGTVSKRRRLKSTKSVAIATMPAAAATVRAAAATVPAGAATLPAAVAVPGAATPVTEPASSGTSVARRTRKGRQR